MSPSQAEGRGFDPRRPLQAWYELRIREPDWVEHRLFSDILGGVNLHVFSDACPETERMVQFRDWLRSHPDDRELYAQTKQELAVRHWTYMQQYADARLA